MVPRKEPGEGECSRWLDANAAWKWARWEVEDAWLCWAGTWGTLVWNSIFPQIENAALVFFLTLLACSFYLRVVPISGLLLLWPESSKVLIHCKPCADQLMKRAHVGDFYQYVCDLFSAVSRILLKHYGLYWNMASISFNRHITMASIWRNAVIFMVCSVMYFPAETVVS